MTGVAGDVDGCVRLGAALQRAAARVAGERDRLARARDGALGTWRGAAADAFGAQVDRQLAAADRLSAQLAHMTRVLTEFAADLEQAQLLARRADALLESAAPEDLTRGDRLRQAAQQAADEAHRRLAVGLHAAAADSGGWHLSPPSGPDWADLVDSLVVAPRAFAARAALRTDAASELVGLRKGATKEGTVAERAAARVDYNAALREVRELRKVESSYAGIADSVPVPRLLDLLDDPVAEGLPVLSRIPVASVVTVAASSYLDTQDGMSVGLAVTKNAAATGAGMLAYTGAAAGLAAVGLVGAPVILGAVGAGVVASWAVGEVVEHYGDDISAAAGEVADAVGDAAGAVGGAAEDAAGAVAGAASDAWHGVFG